MGNLSEHFSEIEFTCRCGCRTFVKPGKLISILENFREFCCKETKREVRFLAHCGLRCPTHNKNIGGVKGSRHLPRFYKKNQGAFDFHSPDISNIRLRRLARKARKLKILCGGTGFYRWGIHVDSSNFRRWGLWI